MTMTIFTSPLEQFEVVPLLSLNSPLFVNLSLTNLGLYSLIVLVLSIGLHVVVSARLVPSR